MSLGFIIIRHVKDSKSNLYWKESYRCIRKFYEEPIIIIDDSSNPEFVKDDIEVINTTIIYDKDHKGAGEILPYYYFLMIKPFDRAIVIHDTVFIQKKIDFGNDDVSLLWTFPHYFDDEIFHLIKDVIEKLEKSKELIEFYHQKEKWLGCFGVMSVITWNKLNEINENHKIFDNIFKIMNQRSYRHALERVYSLLVYYNSKKSVNSIFNNIFQYCHWGINFDEYCIGKYNHLPIVKVWVGR